MVGTIVFLVVGVMAVCATSFLVLILLTLRCSNYLEYCWGEGQIQNLSSSLLSGV